MNSIEIVERVQALLAMELRVYGFDPLVLRRALDLCAAKRVAIYDAYLIALAKQEGLIFVTADEKLARKFDAENSVKSLRSFAPLFKGNGKTNV
jgi:predicted nucleic acid-binding protein